MQYNSVGKHEKVFQSMKVEMQLVRSVSGNYSAHLKI